MKLDRRRRWWLLLTATVGIGCSPALVEPGDEDPDTGESEPTDGYGTRGGTTDRETSATSGPYGSTATEGSGVTTYGTYSTGEYTSYGTDTWGSSYGSTWIDSDGSSSGGPVLIPEDCDYLAPGECEGQGGNDFVCVVQTGYLLESAASCSFDEFAELCVAVALPLVETCQEQPSCPAQGTATVWAGHSQGEPVVLVQQGCREYPSLDYCITGSPDPSCACACTADVAGGNG